jgi:YgiT-type zinc finger domain-containing protein
MSKHCTICKKGKREAGSSTLTLTRDDSTVVFKNVPAEVCENCGEEYLSDEITAELLETAEEIIESGVQVDIREYRAA